MAKEIVLDLSKDCELLNKTAKEWANAIERGTKKTQVRNFYEKVLELESRIKKSELGNSHESFEDIYPFIKMLNSKVAYAVSRRVASRDFQNMMEQSLNQITCDDNGKKKFKVFKLFFEAVLGFFKGGN